MSISVKDQQKSGKQNTPFEFWYDITTTHLQGHLINITSIISLDPFLIIEFVCIGYINIWLFSFWSFPVLFTKYIVWILLLAYKLLSLSCTYLSFRAVCVGELYCFWSQIYQVKLNFSTWRKKNIAFPYGDSPIHQSWVKQHERMVTLDSRRINESHKNKVFLGKT